MIQIQLWVSDAIMSVILNDIAPLRDVNSRNYPLPQPFLTLPMAVVIVGVLGFAAFMIWLWMKQKGGDE